MHGRGVYVAGGMCGRVGVHDGGGACVAGRHAWQGGMHGGGHAWQGGMHGRGVHVWWGACMVGGVRAAHTPPADTTGHGQ